MEMGLRTKIKSKSGMSLVVLITFIVALVLVLIIVIPIALGYANGKMNDLDSEQVTFAERQARVEYQTNNKAFSAIFDTENKSFVDEKVARTTVTPYGTSEENIGKYLKVTVDEKGNVSTTWISPY